MGDKIDINKKWFGGLYKMMVFCWTVQRRNICDLSMDIVKCTMRGNRVTNSYEDTLIIKWFMNAEKKSIRIGLHKRKVS